jgi:3-hydroxyacyl-[acyl-carrier-protein] dehydratase
LSPGERKFAISHFLFDFYRLQGDKPDGFPLYQMTDQTNEPNVSATGIKNVSVNEPYFAGHFPDTPIMPGVLLIESAAQLCSLVFAPESVEEDKLYVLLKVKDFKMLRPVIPGDTLIISVNVTMSTKSAFEFACVIKVDGEVRAKGSLLFTTMDKNAVYKPSQE